METLLRWRGRKGAFLVVLAGGICSSAVAGATYSISALDRESVALGGAGASCVPYPVDVIFGVVPGVAVVNMQAGLDAALKEQALELLRAGWSAPEVLAQVTDASVYPNANRMQWGIVDVAGRSLAWTGSAAMPFAGHLLATSGARYVATFQGNLLTSARVLEQARAGFDEPGCDLAERLMRGLEAAAQAGEGDQRCTGNGRPAKSAYLDVTTATGTLLHLSIPDVSPEDPSVVLRAEFERWRATNPCPVQPPAAQAAEPAPEASSGCALAHTSLFAATSQARSAALSSALLWAVLLALTVERRIQKKPMD